MMKFTSKNFGVKHKLYFSLLAINCLALLIMGTSWEAFRTSSLTLRKITSEMLPVTETVAEVILLSSDLNALVPKILFVKDHEALDDLYAQMITLLHEQRQKALTIKRKGNSDQDIVNIIFNVETLNDQLIQRLASLKEGIKGQLILNEQRRVHKKELLNAHAQFIVAISPVSDDAQFELIIGLEELDLSQLDSLSLQTETLAYALEIKAEGNYLVGILETALGLENSNSIVPLLDRFDSARQRMESRLAQINQGRSEFVIINQSFDTIRKLGFGLENNNIFDNQKKRFSTQRRLKEDLKNVENVNNKINGIVYTLERQISAKINDLKEKTQEELRFGIYMIVAVSALSVLFSFFISWFYIKPKIIDRLEHLKNVMLRTAESNFDDTVDETGHDEISDMAGALSVFRRKIIENISLSEEVDQIAQIPLNNPYPVIRLTMDGDVTISNDAANDIFPGLAQQRFDNAALVGLENYIQAFEANNDIEPLRREVIGGDRIFSQTVHPTIVNDQKSLILFFHDITPIKEAQNELQKKTNFLDALIANIPMALFAKDVQDGYKYITWNKEAENTFGLPAHKMMGTTDYDHFPKEEADFFVAKDRETIAEGALIKIDKESITTEPKGTFFAETYKMPIFDDSGKPIILLGLLSDITERIERQEELEVAKENAEKSSRAKSDFLANMSHEIRTPMNAVLGMSSLLLDTHMDQEQVEYARGIHSAGGNLLHIINDIIDISKIEAGKLVLEKISFDLFELVQEVTDLYSYQAWEKQIEIMIDADPALHHQLQGDPTRLKQIFANLISNALKFTREGHILIKITELSRQKDLIEFECRINDTGIGIPEDKLDDVFQKFTQAEESTTRKYGGTGLGLTIVTELTELMGGTIRVESVVNEGTSFIFSVLLEADKTVNYLPQVTLDTSTNILVIDDSEFAQKMIVSVLKKAGLECTVVGSAEDALLCLKSSKKLFDVCFVDRKMDGMDGIEFAEQVRADDSYKEVALIMVSGVTDIVSYSDLAKKGFNGFLKKPFLPDQILAAIGIALREENLSKMPFVTSSNVRDIRQNKDTQAIEERKQYPDVKVLAVDDMKMNMIIIKKVLQNFGCQIDTASDGAEAVDKATDNVYDVVFMDCQMPKVDGFEATKMIRGVEAESNRDAVSIVALTADAMVGDREKCLSAGMNDYINKPFKESDIAQALEKWCGNQN